MFSTCSVCELVYHDEQYRESTLVQNILYPGSFAQALPQPLHKLTSDHGPDC